MSILSRTLSDQAFDIIRERILSNQWEPLAPIRQDALAESLGISKIPLREALARLEQHGLLISQVNRGYVVPALTAAEAEELFALRLKIEPDAAATASLEANEQERVDAMNALASLEAAEADVPGCVALNRAFHLALVNPVVEQLPRNWLNACKSWRSDTCANIWNPKAVMPAPTENIAPSSKPGWHAIVKKSATYSASTLLQHWPIFVNS